MENNTPINPSGSSLLIKLVIGFIIGGLISLVVFIMFILLGSTIAQAIKNSANHLAFSPLVWLVFMAIGLIWSILGTLILSLLYNVIWSQDYYDIKLMSSGILSVNLLLLVPFLFLYFFTWTILQDIKLLFIVFAFHLLFSVYLSLTSIDIIKNPNYSLVYVVGDGLGFIMAILIFFVIFSLSSWVDWSVEKNVLLFPSILAFSLIPFFWTLFEKIYYKFYEMWNDFLYVPSISEVLVDEEEVDEINVKVD